VATILANFGPIEAYFVHILSIARQAMWRIFNITIIELRISI